ncbi:uncharacterized protein YbdG-like [Glandiceps talaboti]
MKRPKSQRKKEGNTHSEQRSDRSTPTTGSTSTDDSNTNGSARVMTTKRSPISPQIQKPGLCSRCISIGKYVLLAMVLPAFLNHASLYKEAEVLTPPGQLYDIGGQKLYMHCIGKGAPTVILDAPTGMTSDVWFHVHAKLAKLTRVCVYDRAGLGFSEAPSRIQNASTSEDAKEVAYMQNRWQAVTIERMADDLKRLLTHTDVKVEWPYILVGSELGGLNMRFYAQLYESDVSDVVLIDPITEGLFEVDDGTWNQFWFGHLVPSFEALHLSAIVGLTRIGLLLGMMHQPITAKDVPEEIIARQKYLLCTGRHLGTVVDEHYFINESISQIRTLWQMKSFPSNISVTVITGNYYDEQIPSNLNTAWAKSNQYLISQVHPGCKHIVINGADHHMLYRNPDAVVDPIKRLVKQWRNRHSNSPKL